MVGGWFPRETGNGQRVRGYGPVNPEGGLINTVEEAWGEGKSSPSQAQVGEGTTRRVSPFTHPTIHYKKSWRPLAPWRTTKYPTSCSRQTGTWRISPAPGPGGKWAQGMWEVQWVRGGTYETWTNLQEEAEVSQGSRVPDTWGGEEAAHAKSRDMKGLERKLQATLLG